MGIWVPTRQVVHERRCSGAATSPRRRGTLMAALAAESGLESSQLVGAAKACSITHRIKEMSVAHWWCFVSYS